MSLTADPRAALCRFVLVPTDPDANNGRIVGPAVIVGLNEDEGTINVQAFSDSGNVPDWRTGCRLVEELPSFVEAGQPVPHVYAWPTTA